MGAGALDLNPSDGCDDYYAPTGDCKPDWSETLLEENAFKKTGIKQRTFLRKEIDVLQSDEVLREAQVHSYWGDTDTCNPCYVFLVQRSHNVQLQ